MFVHVKPFTHSESMMQVLRFVLLSVCPVTLR